MKKVMVLGLALVCASLMASQAEAQGGPVGSGPGCGMRFITRQVTCYRPVFSYVPQKVKVNRLVCKTVMQKRRVATCVLKWRNVPISYTAYRAIPHHGVRNVTCCNYVPVTVWRTVCCYTACCGCGPCVPQTYKVPCTVYRPNFYTKQVPYTYYTCQSYPVNTTVRQCYREIVWNWVNVPCTVTECVPQWITVHRRVCNWQPHTYTVRIPVCPPTPCCAAVGCGGCYY